MSFQLVARILRSRAHVSVWATTLSSRQWQAPQRVTKRWLSTVNHDNSSFRLTVKKDADLVLEEIRNSIHRNVRRILTHQPSLKKDWERNLRRLNRTQYSSDLPWKTTTSQVKLSAHARDASPCETTSNAKFDGFPWDKPLDDTLHVANVSQKPQISKVSASNNVAFDAAREEIATRTKDPVEGLSPSANTRVSTNIPNSEPEPCKDESLISTSQVRVDVMRANINDKVSGKSDGTLRIDKSSKMYSAMSTNETNPRRKHLSILELLRQPLEEESLVMKNAVTTPEKVSDTAWPSQPSSLLDLLNDDSASTSAVDTQKVQNTFRVNVPDKSSTPWANESGFGNDTIEPQLVARPQSLVELLRRPIDVESPSIGGENGQIASPAGASPQVRVDGVTSAKMPAFDFDDESSEAIRALGSFDLILDEDEDDNKVARENWSYVLEEKPKTVETPNVQIEESDTTATIPSMPLFNFCNDLDDEISTLGSGEEILHERSDKNRLAPENWVNVSGTGNSWQTDPSSRIDADIEHQTSSPVLDQGLAILLAMKYRDFEQLEPVAELPEEDFPPEYEVIEIELESNSESEERSDEYEDKITSLGDNEDDASFLRDMRDLLEWTSFGDILLSTADYNAVLLQLATSTLQTDEAIKMMVKTYRHMTEVGQSDAKCAPDAMTYTILMVALDRRARAPSAAAEICKEMMSSNVKLSPEALIQGIGSFQRRNNVKHAECLFNSALDSVSQETTVTVSAWLGLLRIYKHLDMQREAVNLVTRCIQVNGAKDNRCVSKVITDVIYWPRKDFRGRRISASQLLTNVLDLLESNSLRREGGASMDTLDVDARKRRQFSDSNWVGPTDDASVQSQGRDYDWKKPSYMLSFMAWRQLIVSLSTAAEAEAGADWPVVHRAFTAMQSSLAAFCPDALILKVGIRTAEMTRDADLATDLVIRAQDVEFEATQESHADSSWSDSGQAVGDPESESIVFDPTESDLDSNCFGVKGSDDLSISTDTSLNESVGSTDVFNSKEVELMFDSDITHPDSLTSSSNKPCYKTVRATPQAFASAIRLCVATGNMTSSEKLLDCLRDPRNTFPSSIKSDLYTLAMKGYTKVGDSDTVLNLLKEMQNYGPKPTEEAYGTVIHSLAVTKRTEEADELFKAVDTGRFRDNVSPGLTCYDGRMLAYMEANAWGETLAFHSKMKEAGIPWSPLCFQGVLLASSRLGDRAKALEAIEGALRSGMQMDHYCCELSMRIILGDFLKFGKIDQARTKLRHIGKENRFLQSTSLNLSRALRAAEVEERRQPTNGLKLHEIVSRRNRTWNSAVQHLVYFARAIEKDDSEVISY